MVPCVWQVTGGAAVLGGVAGLSLAGFLIQAWRGRTAKVCVSGDGVIENKSEVDPKVISGTGQTRPWATWS